MSGANQPVNHRRALERLARQGLARRVDVNQKQRGGRRGGVELLFYLSDARSGEAIIAGAMRNGIKDPVKAKTNYTRGGLKGRHTKIRNDFLIRAILDAGRTPGVEVDRERVGGESHRGFPVLGAKVTHDKAGRKLSGFDLAKARYEELQPDGYLPVRFRADSPGGGSVECPFLVELELWTRTDVVAEKIDGYAAAWARMHGDAVRRWADKSGRSGVPRDYFVGLPPEVAPVVFLFETGAAARRMRDRLYAGEGGPMDRYDAFAGRLADFGVYPGRLFLFCGMDDILPRLRYSDPDLGELRETSGHVFDAVYAEFAKYLETPEKEDDGRGATLFARDVSLREVALYRRDCQRDRDSGG